MSKGKMSPTGMIIAAILVGGSIIYSQGGFSGSTRERQPAAPVVTATERVTPEPAATPKPVPVYNGQIIRQSDYEGVANFTIKASSYSNHYIYLQYKSAPENTTVKRTRKTSASSPYEDDLAFFVEAGKEATIEVPIGTYKLYYASGDTYFGEKLLFGDRTSFYSSDDLLTFHADEDYIYGHTVTLTAVVNGNFDTDPVSESQFPGRQ